jgi:uncharacterized protein (DUF1330 family)
MPKVYTVIAYRSVSDPAALAAYAELAGPAITALGGRIVARGMPRATVEDGLQQRLVILEWNSVEQAVGLYSDPGYLKAMAKLGDAAERDIRVIPAAE